METSHNIYDSFFSATNPVSPKIVAWLDKQEAWTREHIKGEYGSLSPFWQSAASIMAQYDGLQAGYLFAAGNNTSLPVSTKFAFQLLAGYDYCSNLIQNLNVTTKILLTEQKFILSNLPVGEICWTWSMCSTLRGAQIGVT